jgi:hypothetical protein
MESIYIRWLTGTDATNKHKHVDENEPLDFTKIDLTEFAMALRDSCEVQDVPPLSYLSESVLGENNEDLKEFIQIIIDEEALDDPVDFALLYALERFPAQRYVGHIDELANYILQQVKLLLGEDDEF